MSSNPTPRSIGFFFHNPMARIGIKLLTKAALCAATIALIAGMVAALFFRS